MTKPASGAMSRVLLSIGTIQVVIMLVTLVRAKSLSIVLGPGGFGVASTIDQTVLTLVQIGALSLPFTSMKFLARSHSTSREDFERTFVAFLRALSGLGVITAGAAVALLAWKPHLLGADLSAYRWPLVTAVLAVPVLIVNILIANVLAAAQRSAASVMVQLVIAASLTVAAVGGVLVGGLAGLYASTTIIALVTTGALLRYTRRGLGLHLTARPAGLLAELRRSPEIVSYSAQIYAAMTAYSLTMLATRYFVIGSLGEAHAGHLQALLSIAVTVGAVLTPMTGLYLAPLVNRRAPVAEKAAAANEFAGKVLLVLALVVLPIALFPRLALLVLFSPEFTAAAAAVSLFLFWQCLHQVVNVYTQLLVGLDDVPFVSLTLCAGYAVTAALFPVLVSRVGLAGCAAALTASMVLSGAAFSLRLRTRFQRAVSGRVLQRCALVLGAVVGVWLVFDPASEWTTAGILGRTTYALLVAALLLRTMSRDERGLLVRVQQQVRGHAVFARVLAR